MSSLKCVLFVGIILYVFIAFILFLTCITNDYKVKFTSYKTNKVKDVNGILKYFIYLLLSLIWPITCRRKTE